MRLQNRLEPATLQRSPIFTNIDSGVIYFASKPINNSYSNSVMLVGKKG